MPKKQVISKELISGIATIETNDPHFMLVDTPFLIKNVDSILDGQYVVLEVINDTKISFSVDSEQTIAFTSISPVGSLTYAFVDTAGRPAYMYDEETESWYLLASKVDTGANYVWYGTHLFSAPVTVDDEFTIVGSASVSGDISISGNAVVSGVLDLSQVTASVALDIPTSLRSASANITEELFAEEIKTNSPINNFVTLVERDSKEVNLNTECYVQETNKKYVYKSSGWVEVAEEVGFEDIFLLMGG